MAKSKGSSFQPGDTLRVKSAMYRHHRFGNSPIMRGQLMEVTEEDLARSDASLIWEAPDDVGKRAEAEVSEIEVEDAVDDTDTQADFDKLREYLQKSNFRDAKKFLSRDEWDADGMALARQAEEAGKARTRVLAFIDGRIEQIRDEAEDDFGDGPEDEATES